MNAIAGQLENAFPNTNQGWHTHVIPIAEFVTGELVRSYTLLLLGAVAANRVLPYPVPAQAVTNIKTAAALRMFIVMRIPPVVFSQSNQF